MITADTVKAFFADMDSKSQVDKSVAENLVSNFCEKHPHVIFGLVPFILGCDTKDKVTDTIIVLAVYEEIRLRQESSDDLRRKIR